MVEAVCSFNEAPLKKAKQARSQTTDSKLWYLDAAGAADRVQPEVGRSELCIQERNRTTSATKLSNNLLSRQRKVAAGLLLKNNNTKLASEISSAAAEPGEEKQLSNHLWRLQ